MGGHTTLGRPPPPNRFGRPRRDSPHAAGNRVRERLLEGAPAIGARAETFAPPLVEVYGRLGFDFVWLDFEHGGPSPLDAPAVTNLVRAAECAGIELLARLPAGDPPLVHKVLDAGVRTVLIPRVETAAEVRRAVRAARFAYDGGAGDRGFGAGRPSGWGDDLDEGYRILRVGDELGAVRATLGDRLDRLRGAGTD